MKGRTGLVLGLGLLVVLAAVVISAVVVTQVLPQHRRPPAFTSSGPGSVRLTYPNRHLPNPPVAVPGSDVRLTMVDVREDGGKTVAVINAFVPGQEQPIELRLGAGQSATAGSATVRVVHAYDLPNPAHDAVDVMVSPTA